MKTRADYLKEGGHEILKPEDLADHYKKVDEYHANNSSHWTDGLTPERINEMKKFMQV